MGQITAYRMLNQLGVPFWNIIHTLDESSQLIRMAQHGQLYFLTGIQRSGTTVCTEALADALGAYRLTLAHLAEHMPVLADFLAVVTEKKLTVDRGVDSRLVADDLTAEYGWYLLCRTLRRRFGFRPWDKRALELLAHTVAEGNPDQRVIMKNPWDVGNEVHLLRAFPTSIVILLRRPLPEIEASTYHSFFRRRTDFNYILALFGRSWLGPFWVWCLSGPLRLRAVYLVDIWRIRLRVIRAAHRLRKLPLERVVFLDYGELRENPFEAVKWASNLVDADEFGQAFSARCLPSDVTHGGVGSTIVRLIDRYWSREWDRARRNQQGTRADP